MMLLFRGQLVAFLGGTRCYVVADDLDPRSLRFVMAMCLCKREVDEGRIAGPFTSELAERWARLVLVGPSSLAARAGTDDELAEQLSVPVDQVVLARAEWGRDVRCSVSSRR